MHVSQYYTESTRPVAIGSVPHLYNFTVLADHFVIILPICPVFSLLLSYSTSPWLFPLSFEDNFDFLPPHCGTKPGHFETSKIHFPTSEGVSEVNERANE